MSTPNVCIVDYGMGNLMSVLRAFELIGSNVVVSNKHEDIIHAERIILPGVGAFSVAMDNLHALGLVDVLTEQVLVKKKPLLGICLGMQLIASDSYEHGYYKGLNWIPASVIKLETKGNLRVPHMGWNEVKAVKREKSIFENVDDDATYYFVHSYHVKCEDPKYIGSTTWYGEEFTSSIQFENIYAAQFHPEKSQKNGIQLLRNFIKHTSV